MKRRSFLKGLAAGAALAPIGIHTFARSARAAGEGRALFVYIPDGCIPDRWHPRGSSGSSTFTLPEMSAPLERVRQHLTFLDGLDMYAGGPTHEGGCAKVLTGTDPTSLDVFLGQTLREGVPHPSVHLGVGANFENGSGSFSRLMGTEVKPDDDPLNAFSRLFGGREMTDTSAEELRIRRRRSVLDAISGDLTALRARLGAVERTKLDVHTESLRELERRLMAPVGGSCSDVAFNAGGYRNVETDYYPKTYHKEDNFLTVGRLQQDLAVLSLGCGITRVASIMWSHPVSPTHVRDTTATLGNHDASHYGNADSDTARQFVALKRWFAERFAELIEKLATTPDGEGTLLDSTVVMLCSELGDSNAHDHKRVPFVVAGGAGVRLRGNRFIDYRGGHGGENEAHSKLLVSIAQAVGVPVDTYGYSGHGSGGLEGLLI
ncbi:DUF1552 domain-containing protein [Sandaracinus amylolyticus]|uniref:Tat (Twin-arginine translocation) pathway signal sequence domain protein n=1 Tax=Sandaracinus amylolyticus TaxID=927083 RepID=A0A0F6YIQ2_9BACT|nr:DUF1552 domain-containing protein [Sandaracinus amylolyticus]AKF07251.1 Tat (Twin-arginine translocation) pathway signal sequence domain protein [Sandaracinus amylolyticus]